jgi:signal transduction histidine kinase
MGLGSAGQPDVGLRAVSSEGDAATVDTGRQTNKTSRRLAAGFISVLLIMAIVMVAGLVYLHRSNASLQHIIQIHNVKTRLLGEMRDAMRERQISIRDMVIKSDPFAKDEAWQQHNDAATRFIGARDEFFSFERSSREEQAVAQLRADVTEGGDAQQNLVQLILDAGDPDMIAQQLDQVIEVQNAAFRHMENLFGIQQEAAQEALYSARMDYRHLRLLAIVLGGGCMVASIMISWYVVRSQRGHMALISRYQENLEELVEGRTAELRVANRELESYSYSLAHDLRTPLRAVTGFSQMLMQETAAKLDAEESGYLSKIAKAGKHMTEVIDDMQTLVRISRSGLEKRPVDVSGMVEQLVEEAVQLRDCAIACDIAAGVRVQADPSMLRLALRQLIDNAIKFSRAGEEIRLQFGQLVSTPSVLFLRDNGIGFECDYAEKIFKAFERLHADDRYEGTGIGLAMVERVIKRHNGRIWAESEPGKGTMICFTLGEQPARA